MMYVGGYDPWKCVGIPWGFACVRSKERAMFLSFEDISSLFLSFGWTQAERNTEQHQLNATLSSSNNHASNN